MSRHTLYGSVLFLSIVHSNKVAQVFNKTSADCDFALFKTPDTPNSVVVVLIVVVLVAIVEVLVPRVVRIVLSRTPIVVIGKTALNNQTLRAMESRRRRRVVPGSLRAVCFSAGKI